MELIGKLTSGMGTAKIWVSKIEKIFEEKTNIKLYHGTLNIKLENDYIVEPEWVILPNEFGGTQNVLIKKCKIFGYEAYIVRAEKNQKGQGEHDLKILEIVADINFRDTYNLKDNQEIKIEV